MSVYKAHRHKTKPTANALNVLVPCNKYVFSKCLKLPALQSDARRLSGKEFEADGPAAPVLDGANVLPYRPTGVSS